MAEKRVYRRIKDEAANLVGLWDGNDNVNIPLSDGNRHYEQYKGLLALDLAVLLDMGEALPEGVSNSSISFVRTPISEG